MKALDQIDDRDDNRTDWEKLTDGRQTRPANDVGGPHGRAKRAALDGRRYAEAFGRYQKAEARLRRSFNAWEKARAALRRAEKALDSAEVIAFDERLRRGEAPHGEAPPDAEA